MIKLVCGSKNKIVKHGDRGFSALRDIIKTNFPEAPIDYSLSYLDQDKDEISLNCDQDLVNMFTSIHTKVHKVYIKESLSQTLVVDLERSDYIEAPIENTESVVIKIDKNEGIKEEVSFAKPSDEEKKVKVQEAKEVGEDEKKVQLENMKEEATEIKIDEFSDIEKEEVKKDEDPFVAPQEEAKEPEKKEAVKQDQQVQAREEVKVDVAIQSQVIEVEKKEIETIKMEVDPKKIVVSSSKEYKIQKRPSIEEQKRNVTRAKIFGNIEEVKKIPKKDVNGDLLFHEVICSRCKDEFGIIGIRYQCILCDHFNLCGKCQEEVEHEHSLVKVKQPEKAIKKDDLINKFKKEIEPEPRALPMIPPNHYVPSIDRRDSERVINAAREAYKQGMERSNRLIEELFFSLETSHKNPYQVAKPIAPVRVETVFQKAKNLQELVNIPYNEAQRFVSQYPNLNSEKVIETYFRMKNL